MLIKYLTTILLLLSFTVTGQIKKQTILLGGQLFYYNGKNQIDNATQKTETGTVSLSIGKAIRENKIVGVNLSFSPIRQSNIATLVDTTSLTFNRFDIGMFYREYKKLTKDFYFFSQIDGAFITTNQTEHFQVASGDIKAIQRGAFISLTPGISYQIFKKMQLEITIPNVLSAQYLFTKIDSKVNQVSSSTKQEFLFFSNINNSTGLGFLGVGFRFLL